MSAAAARLPTPRSLSELTPAWMTAALARRCPGAVVEEVKIDGVVDGTNRRASVALRYAEGSGPSRVFVKAHGRMLHRLALLALGALSSEALLFESGVPLPLERPLAYAATADRRRLRSIVVMEDVTVRSGRPNDARAPLSVEQVRSGLQGLASLHAAYWDRPLPAELSFVRPWRLGRAWAPVSRANLARGLRRLNDSGNGSLMPASLVRASVAPARLTGGASSAGLLERQFRASAKLAATGPQTLLHGDPHPGNTYALPGDLTGLYDWQLVRSGSWSHDVGYFVGSSLDVESRRAHERALLAEYLDALGENLGARGRHLDAPGRHLDARGRGSRGGGRASGSSGNGNGNDEARPPGFEEAWGRYRASPAFGLCTWLHTFAAGSFQPDAVCLATIERFAAAYEDLDTRRAPALAGITG